MKKLLTVFALLIVFLLIPVQAEENDNHIYYWNFNEHGRELSNKKLDIVDYDTMDYADGKLSKALDLTEPLFTIQTEYSDCTFEQYTTAMWVYLDENAPDTANFRVVMAKDAKREGHFEIFFMQAGDKYQLRVYSYDLGDAVGVEELIDVGQWIHIAATYDGKYQKLYFNGKEALSEEYDKPLDTSVEESVIHFGGIAEGGLNLYGKIDEAVLANYAFDAELIAKLHDNPEEAANTLTAMITEKYPEGETPIPDVTPSPEPTQEPTPTPEVTKNTQATATKNPGTSSKKPTNGFVIPVIIVVTVVIAAVVVFLIIKPGKKKN